MSEQAPQPSPEVPSLGDVLQLQATIEALPEVGLRDISETERIAISRFPEGKDYSEGTMLSHISLSQRVKDSGNYAAAMNYIVLRDGDEATTRLIKRPPFEVPKISQDINPQSAQDLLDKVRSDAALYDMARQTGFYDLTTQEVHELTGIISQTYSHDK